MERQSGEGGAWRQDPFFSREAVLDIASAMTCLIADALALYVKTKAVQWHMSGPWTHDYQRMLAEQAEQIFPLIEAMASRIRRIGGTTLRSLGQAAELSQIAAGGNASPPVPLMLEDLCADNAALADRMRQTHGLCLDHGDVSGAGVLGTWIGEAEQRVWILAECGAAPAVPSDPPGWPG